MWVVLVLSALTKTADLRAQVARFRELDPKALVVTHVDETDDLTNVLNLVLDDASPPLAWIGTGQRVPEDLEIPTPARLLDALLQRRSGER